MRLGAEAETRSGDNCVYEVSVLVMKKRGGNRGNQKQGEDRKDQGEPFPFISSFSNFRIWFLAKILYSNYDLATWTC